MNYTKEITISGWEEIADKYKHYVSEVGKLKALMLPKEDHAFLESKILPQLESQLNTKHSIQSAMLFFMTGNSSRGIHVDGDKLERSHLAIWGLNIPILNCANSEMKWYNGDYKLNVTSSPTGLDYLGITWSDGPYEVESVVIDKPTLVYVDVPHNVFNYSNNPRVLLSVRFTPDLFKV